MSRIPKSKPDLPQYADWGAITVTRGQFIKASKGRRPNWMNSNEAIRVAKTNDGVYWAEWKGDYVFWARRWYKIPTTVGKRVEKINEFVQTI